MMIKLLSLLSGIILVFGISLVFAQEFICDGEVCTYHGKFNVEGDQAGIVVSPVFVPGCQEQWSCSCSNSTTSCIDLNECGTNNTIPASHGQSCGISGGPSGGGGPSGVSSEGGGREGPRVSSCVETWQCEEWEPCVNSRQKRSCRDLAQCGTTVLKPSIERDCISEPELTIGDEERQTSGLLGAILGALGNLGKSKIAVVVTFVALVLAAALIISAIRGSSPVPQEITSGNKESAASQIKEKK